MGFFKKVFLGSTSPRKNNYRGRVGEAQVNSKLNPFFFGKVNHKQINNLILLDAYGNSHEIDHVEIRSNGIFVIETKNYSGWIFGSEKQQRWTQTLFNQKNQFLNPIIQNESHIYHINKVLKNKYKINSLIVFTQNNANRIDAPYVINLSSMKTYLKKFDNGVRLTDTEIDSIYSTLISSANKSITTTQHANRVKTTQRKLEEGICPRCGGRLKKRNGKYGIFHGCSNYPKCKFTINKK